MRQAIARLPLSGFLPKSAMSTPKLNLPPKVRGPGGRNRGNPLTHLEKMRAVPHPMVRFRRGWRTNLFSKGSRH
ncbi:MAG: hypothetical protein DME45_02020 [Verrucomicrobia bacterium]|nr:MAG: hypothetical protein DME45_02020 [Verrucomicrobiota bacterium]